MNYMEICANFENGACQWWSEEGDKEEGGILGKTVAKRAMSKSF